MIRLIIFILIIIIIIIFYKKNAINENFIVDANDIHNYPFLRQRVLNMSNELEDCSSINNMSFKGSNYNTFTNFANYDQHIRILSQNTKGLPPDQSTRHIPEAYNYAFSNSPAF